MQKQLKQGARIRLVSMPQDPDPIPNGSLGTVVAVYEHRDWMQVDIEWDNGRTLMLVSPPDKFTIVANDTNTVDLDTPAPMYHDGDTLVDQARVQNMIKNFVKHGNSWAVVIDRPILDLLKIDPESQFEMTTDGKSIQITPLDAVKAKVRDARAKVNAKDADQTRQ